MFPYNQTSFPLNSVYAMPGKGPGLQLHWYKQCLCLQRTTEQTAVVGMLAFTSRGWPTMAKLPLRSGSLNGKWCSSAGVHTTAHWKGGKKQWRPRSLAVVIFANQINRCSGDVFGYKGEEGMSLVCIYNIGCRHLKCFKQRCHSASLDWLTSSVPCHSRILALGI